MERGVRLKALLVALSLIGVITALAVAAPPGGKGKGHGASVVTTTVTTTTTVPATRVTLCHLARSRPPRYVPVGVPPDAVWMRVKHGDVLPDASGHCPGPGSSPGHGKHA
jgi:hypothetical protein